VVLLLVALGTVMVYSASSTVAMARFGDGAYYLKRHLIRVALGLSLMFLFARARYKRVVQLGRPLMAISFAALLLVLIPGLGGVAANGANRWLALGPLTFQPSELARFALLLWLAETLVTRRSTLEGFTDGLLPVLAPVAAAVALIVIEPDFSTAVAVAAVCGGMIFIAGARTLHLGGVIAGSIPLIYFALISSDYRRARIAAFLEGAGDVTGANYQVWQSLIGLGSGGLLGKGLGNGAQKLRFLPEPFNDFIFSIVGEELGLVGALVLLLLFLVLVIRGFRVAASVNSPVGALLAAGVSLSIGLYVLINIGVVTSLIPATGLALPFISYGGSSLIFSLAGVGMLLSITREVELEPVKFHRRHGR
jgi:cell division protein FtsW